MIALLLYSSQVETKIIDSAKKVRTLSKDKIIVSIAFNKGSAVQIRCWPDQRPTLQFVGNYFQSRLPSVPEITVADRGFMDFAILMKSQKKCIDKSQSGLIFDTDESESEQGGCLLVFGNPDSEKLHIRLLTKRSSCKTVNSFKVTDLEDLWIVKNIFEPLIISYGIRINWERLVEEIFAVRYRRIVI